MLQRTSCLLTALVCTAMLPVAAWPADAAATVDASGMASVRLVPTKLRMQVQVIAHGKTTELAVERLKARREAVADSLAALGAERQSVNFGESSVSKISPPSAPAYAVPPSYSSPYQNVPTPYYTPPPTTYAPATSSYPPSPPPVLTPNAAPRTLTPVPVDSSYLPPSAGEGPSAPYAPSLAPSNSKTPVPTTTYLPPPSAGEAPSAPLAATVVPAAAAAVPPLPPGGYTIPATAYEPARQLEIFGNVPTTTYAPPPAAPHGTTAPARPRGGPQELYVSTATLTIDWPLYAGTVEQAALAGEAIRKKVEAAGDLMRGKAAEKLPADEQELLEEMAPVSSIETVRTIQQPVVETAPNGVNVVREQVVTTSNGASSAASGGPTSLGQPMYIYVAKITSRQRKAVYAEAFGNAKSQASELAEASGGKLGAISNLSGELNGPWSPTYIPSSAPPPGPGTTNENCNETTAAAPDILQLQAVVRATFKLE